MPKEGKKSVITKTAAPKRASKNVVTTDDGVTTHDAVTTRDHVVMDESVSTNGGVIVDDEDERPAIRPRARGSDRTAQIARLAYAKYEARGFVDGHDLDDWLAAEAEL